MPSCGRDPASGARPDLLVPPSDAKYERGSWRIESSEGPDSPGRWLSGRKHPPAKRVGGVKLPRGFESLPSRSLMSHDIVERWLTRGSGPRGRPLEICSLRTNEFSEHRLPAPA